MVFTVVCPGLEPIGFGQEADDIPFRPTCLFYNYFSAKDVAWILKGRLACDSKFVKHEIS